jgi:hypothetical protein
MARGRAATSASLRGDQACLLCEPLFQRCGCQRFTFLAEGSLQRSNSTEGSRWPATQVPCCVGVEHRLRPEPVGGECRAYGAEQQNPGDLGRRDGEGRDACDEIDSFRSIDRSIDRSTCYDPLSAPDKPTGVDRASVWKL